MSSTQLLLGRIAALRQRLAQVEVLAHGTDPASFQESDTVADSLQMLERKVATGSWHNSLLDSSMRHFHEKAEPPPQPIRLTARSSRLLQRGRDLLHELRRLADEPILENAPLGPLGKLHRETVAMIDSVIRAVQTFPQAPSEQVRLCDGLEAVLNVVAERVSILTAGLDHHRRQKTKVDTLTELMQTLAGGMSLSPHAFYPLAEEILEDSRQNQPLHFFQAEFDLPIQFAACHGLNVAQVAARLVQNDPAWNGRLHEPILASLLHDIGMIRVPSEILAQSGPLKDEQRRQIENHTIAGAEILRRLVPAKNWLVEAAAEHHERVDGTGYPAGLRDASLPALVRVIAVCDIYAALCCPRPYRPALDTRAALTDTLLLAEQGALDKFQAERLLNLSFYPVGSIVELTDGAVGMVMFAHPAHKDLRSPSRPILAMLTDTQGKPLPFPCQLDLVQGEGRSILRTLPADERQELLGTRYPELV